MPGDDPFGEPGNRELRDPPLIGLLPHLPRVIPDLANEVAALVCVGSVESDVWLRDD